MRCLAAIVTAVTTVTHVGLAITQKQIAGHKVDGINTTVKDLHYKHQKDANRFLYVGMMPKHTPENKRYYFLHLADNGWKDYLCRKRCQQKI